MEKNEARKDIKRNISVTSAHECFSLLTHS